MLCGGQSTRMGQDKSLLSYHGLPQREHMFQLLNKYVDLCFYSTKEGSSKADIIADSYDIQSPLNGILSAFEKHGDVAWLVVACDMPLIEAQHIEKLIQLRNPNQLATCFAGSDNKPHPLFTIYEPTSKDRLKTHSKVSKSPRKFLIKECVEIINARDTNFLTSIDSITEFQKLKNRL